MNKKLIFAGLATLAGFVFFSAFKGKTLAEQKAEIANMVTMKLDELRAEKQAECDARIAAEAQTRYDAVVAAREEEAAKPGVAKAGAKKGTKKGPNAPSLPPAKPSGGTQEDKAKSRMSGESGKADEGAAKSRMSGEAPKVDESKAKSRMGGGGGK